MSRILASLTGLMLLAGMASADEPAAGNLQFAEKLFAERDYYRAITEYKRFLFENPAPARAPVVEFRIGESYLAGGKQAAAIDVFRNLRQQNANQNLKLQAGLAIARAYFQQGRYAQSLDMLDPLLLEIKDPDLAGYARYLSGCIFVKIGEVEKSRKSFNSIPAGHRLAPQSLWLAEKVGQAAELPRKSPVLAGVLSLVPGLGHLYLGEYAVAITAFAWNGLFGFATYDTFRKGNYGVGSLLAGLTLLWYSGTIYGAVSGAHRYNRDARLNFYDYLDAGAGLDPEFPDPNFAGGILISGALP